MAEGTPAAVEVTCSDCPHRELVRADDPPAEMDVRTYASWLASNHEAECAGTAEVGAVPAVQAETTKYDTGGHLND